MADLLHTAQQSSRFVYLSVGLALPGCDDPRQSLVSPQPIQSCQTLRCSLHERTAATSCYPRLQQRTWLLVSAFGHLKHGCTTLSTVARAHLSTARARAGDGVLTERGRVRLLPQNSGRCGPFEALRPRELKARPPPHHRSGPRGLRVIGKVTRKGVASTHQGDERRNNHRYQPIKMLKTAGSALGLIAEMIQNARPYYNLLFRAGAEKRSSASGRHRAVGRNTAWSLSSPSHQGIHINATVLNISALVEECI